MSDLEVTKLCAEAMKYTVTAECEGNIWCKDIGLYAPLLKGEQTLELIKNFQIWITASRCSEGTLWGAKIRARKPSFDALDLNRAVCEAVASFQARRFVRSCHGAVRTTIEFPSNAAPQAGKYAAESGNLNTVNQSPDAASLVETAAHVLRELGEE